MPSLSGRHIIIIIPYHIIPYLCISHRYHYQIIIISLPSHTISEHHYHIIITLSSYHHTNHYHIIRSYHLPFSYHIASLLHHYRCHHIIIIISYHHIISDHTLSHHITSHHTISHQTTTRSYQMSSRHYHVITISLSGHIIALPHHHIRSDQVMS